MGRLEPITIAEGDGWEAFFDLIEEWSQLTPGWNWRTFHPIMIEFEDDRMMGAVEGTVIFLGLGFRFRWNYRETEQTRKIARQVAELKDEI